MLCLLWGTSFWVVRRRGLASGAPAVGIGPLSLANSECAKQGRFWGARTRRSENFARTTLTGGKASF